MIATGDRTLGSILLIALTLAEAYWQILAEELERGGCPSELPDFANDTVSCRYEALKWDALVMSDCIYHALPNDLQLKEDADLEVLEITGRTRSDCSARLRALSLLTVAKYIVGESD